MVENEVKFIVRWDFDLEHRLKNGHDWLHIEQAYLNDRARIRKTILVSVDSDDRPKYVFTYKQRLSNGRNIEIETAIDEEDYAGLLRFSLQRLSKSRVSIQEGVVRWDIDFPRWKHGHHFIVAEAEMPMEMEQPDHILEALRPYVVLAVSRSDRRFTARRLSDESVAVGLAIELGLR